MTQLQQNLQNKLIKHKRTGIIRKIFVLEDNETPSSVGILRKFNPITDIILDTYLVNKQFYDIIN